MMTITMISTSDTVIAPAMMSSANTVLPSAMMMTAATHRSAQGDQFFHFFRCFNSNNLTGTIDDLDWKYKCRSVNGFYTAIGNKPVMQGLLQCRIIGYFCCSAIRKLNRYRKNQLIASCQA